MWPSSKGKNWGCGAHMALHEGALVVLLDRMNRILETNEELGLIELFYDRDDPDERTRMLAVYDELAERTLAAGYPQYRTSVWLGEHVLGASPELQRFVDSLKGAVDPNDILAPGRYSIGVPPS